MDIAKKLREQAERHPDKTSIIFKDKQISFKEIVSRINKLANWLLKAGIKKGDRVAIYLPNSPEYAISYFAVFTVGAVAVPLDVRLTGQELTGVLAHSEAAVLITRPLESFSLQGLSENVEGLKNIVVCFSAEKEKFSFDKITAQESDELPDVKIDDNDLAVLFYTSGTTGHPKAVMWNYKNLDNCPMLFEHIHIVELFDVIICALPFSHSGGFVSFQINAVFGSTLVIMERFIPIEFLKNIEKHKVSFFFMVPAMFIALLQLKEFEKYDLSGLRGANVFGAPSDPNMIMRFGKYCPNACLFNGWGMTETSPPNTVSEPNKIKSVGKSAPWCEIKIFDSNDKEISRGEIGEIVIRGWPIMAGYYKEPEMTGRIMNGGWFHTGDLGCFDEENNLYIKGRKKDMIIVGGLNVYSPEVEHVVQSHPKVKEAAVIGVPDKLRGEAVKAVVVLKPGEEATITEIRSFCREKLTHFKIPQIIEFVKILPRTRSGKVQKELLKESAQHAAV
ncbi:MAG: AMP-binding protein [Candidatus Omnitrophota bacterium]|nr:AMP-binding protein [Candidatus Omnitrophota bacterium]